MYPIPYVSLVCIGFPARAAQEALFYGCTNGEKTVFVSVEKALGKSCAKPFLSLITTNPLAKILNLNVGQLFIRPRYRDQWLDEWSKEIDLGIRLLTDDNSTEMEDGVEAVRVGVRTKEGCRLRAKQGPRQTYQR